jgi:hypothetical protein
MSTEQLVPQVSSEFQEVVRERESHTIIPTEPGCYYLITQTIISQASYFHLRTTNVLQESDSAPQHKRTTSQKNIVPQLRSSASKIST